MPPRGLALSVCGWVGDLVQALWVCVLGRVEVWLNCVLVRVFFGQVLRVLVLSACASSVWALLVRVSVGWDVGSELVSLKHAGESTAGSRP